MPTPSDVTGTAPIREGETPDQFSVGESKPPKTYMAMAWSLSHGLDPLAAAGSEAAVALTYVAGQVCECALKAYVSREGDEKRVKRKNIMHDLEALWNLAAEQGLSIASAPPTWLSTLSGLHKTPYFIRYSTKVQGLALPVLPEMVSGTKALVNACSAALKER